MLVSPFTFYRGAAAVMAADLAAAPSTGLMCQLCGDAHLSNFGGFASPDRRHLFDQFRFVDMARKARTPAPATGSRSPPTSAAATRSIGPSAISRTRTQI